MTAHRVLVTGAAGRIGRHVVRALAGAGHAVTGLDRTDAPADVDGVAHVTRRLEELTADNTAFDDVDAVIHLGAFMSWADTDAPAMFDSNVAGTFRLLEAVARRGLRRFVFASTGEVYPENAPVYLPIDEHHPCLPTTHYGMTKQLGEDLVRFYGRKHQLPYVMLRFSHVQDAAELLDPHSFFSGPRFFLAERVAKERAAGNHELADALAKHAGDDEHTLLAATREDGVPARMCILDATDMAAAILLALESPRAVGETLGVGPDDPVDLAEFAREMGRRADLPVAEVTVPVTAANYWTLNARARELLGFRQSLSYDDMIDRAVAARRARSSR